MPNCASILLEISSIDVWVVLSDGISLTDVEARLTVDRSLATIEERLKSLLNDGASASGTN